jgi:hypothetical protein
MAGLLVGGKRSDGATIGNNVEDSFALGVFRETLITPTGLGQYYDLCRRGAVFTVSTAVGATLNGQTNPLGAGGTALVAITNPLASLYDCVILRAGVMMVAGASATMAQPCWNYLPSLTSITAAAGSADVCGRIDGTSKSGFGTWVGAAMTGSIASTYWRNWFGSWSEGRHAGAASENGTLSMFEETDGAIIIPPGAGLIANIAQAGAVLTGCVSILFAKVPKAS